MFFSAVSMRVLSLRTSKLARSFHVGILQPRQSSTTSLDSRSISKDDSAHVKPYEDIPGPRGINNIPFLGLALQMKPFGKHTSTTFPYFLNELVDQYGPIFRLNTNCPTVVITDPKDIATLVRSEGKYPCRPSLDILQVYYQRMGLTPIFTEAQGEEWWHLRRLTQKVMMKPNVMPRYLPEMNEVADDFIDMLADGYLQNRDPEKLFTAYAAESVGAVILNKRLGFLEKEPKQKMKDIQQAVTDVFDIIQRTSSGASISYKFYRSAEYNRYEAIHTFLSRTLSEFLQESINDISENNTDENNFLSFVHKNASFDEACQIIEGSFFAAIESSASAIQTFLHTLGKNQEKQEKLRKELCNVLGDHSHRGRLITSQDITDMDYLRACVKETHRMYPINPTGIVRYLPTDVVFSGYNVPAGVQIMAHPMKTCQNASLFENPDKFQPERWLRNRNTNSSEGTQSAGIADTNKNLAKKWAVIPFGMGSRSCPGRRLFEQELYVSMAKLFHCLKVGLEPKSHEVGFEYRIFRKPNEPIKLTFTPVDRV